MGTDDVTDAPTAARQTKFDRREFLATVHRLARILAVSKSRLFWTERTIVIGAPIFLRGGKFSEGGWSARPSRQSVHVPHRADLARGWVEALVRCGDVQDERRMTVS